MKNILDSMKDTFYSMKNIRAGFNKMKSKAEDVMLAFMLWLAKVTHSSKIEQWLSDYTEKRIREMQKEIIKLNWKKSGLEKKIEQ